MKIVTIGGTRVVILIGKYAFKFPRISVRLAIARLAATLMRGGRQEVAERLRRHDEGGSPVRGALAFLWYCVSPIGQNWREWLVWRKLRHDPSIPIAGTIISLFGLLNVQERGEPFSPEFEQTRCHLEVRLRIFSALKDLVDQKNVAVFNGTLKLVDYGDFNLERVPRGDLLAHVDI